MKRKVKSALLVTDQAGQIIDRLGQSWARHANGVAFTLARSDETPAYQCCARATELGLAHWLDFRRFRRLASAITVPQVAMVHHLTAGEIEPALRSLKHADAIATASVLWQKRLAEMTGREVALMPYTLDVQSFQIAEQSRASRWNESDDERCFVLGFVGKAKANAADRKGTELLLEIMHALSTAGVPVELLLVGPGWDVLAQRVASHGIVVRRSQFATTEETVTAYAQMDALLVTASEEGGPCTVLEAMACGVPVISSVVGHVPELVVDGKTGLLCPGRNAGEYVRHIALLMADAPLRNRIAIQARQLVEQVRDERTVLPEIDFAGIHERARTWFDRRSARDISTRKSRQALWHARYKFGRMMRRQHHTGPP